jgi:endonuclease/exonuclease/phosphatase family metal-dependent hydrolase
MEQPRAPLAFTVRVTAARAHDVVAVIERVRTGERHRVRGSSAIGALITRLATRELRQRRKTMTRIVPITLLAVLGLVAMATAEPAANSRSDRKVTVMSRNLYFGADLAPAIGARSLPEFIGAVTGIFAMVQASDIPGRAGTLAEEIAATQPDLIGLQEVALWRSQLPPDFVPVPNATHVEFDFLTLLLDALAARGLEYAVVAVHVTNDLEAPALLPGGACCREIRLTDREVILALATRPHNDPLELSNAQTGTFGAQLPIPLPGGALYTQRRGWASVDVRARGAQFRFLTTHLEAEGPGHAVQEAQGREIAAGPANTVLPVVVVCDCNSRADGTGTATYFELLTAGFEDAWREAHPRDDGFTCCQAGDLRNAESRFDRRIDFVLVRGGGRAQHAELVGEHLDDRLESGLWPSDHAGVVATLHFQP